MLRRTNYAIPLYFDKSLSYYEQLCAMHNEVMEIENALTQLQQDIDEEIDEKIEQLLVDGRLTLNATYIPATKRIKFIFGGEE